MTISNSKLKLIIPFFNPLRKLNVSPNSVVIDGRIFIFNSLSTLFVAYLVEKSGSVLERKKDRQKEERICLKIVDILLQHC